MPSEATDSYTPFQQAILAEVGTFEGFALVPRAWLVMCLGSELKSFPPKGAGGQRTLTRVLGSLLKWQKIRLLHASDGAPWYMLRTTWAALSPEVQTEIKTLDFPARGRPGVCSVAVLGPAVLPPSLLARYPFPVAEPGTDLVVRYGGEESRAKESKGWQGNLGPLPQQLPYSAYNVPAHARFFRLEFNFP